jgi:hypothetical protein
MAAATARLKAEFPLQVAEVLAQPVSTSETSPTKHQSSTPNGAWRPAGPTLEAVWPLTASAPVVLKGADFSIGVTESGTDGLVESQSASTVMRRLNGFSFWRASGGQAEEWLLVDLPEPSTPGRFLIAEWNVTGGQLALDGETVRVLDASGAARLLVTAPGGFVAEQSATPRLAVMGTRLQVWLEGLWSPGQSALVDPVWRVVGAPMGVYRHDFTLTTLQTGNVLALTQLGPPELYDPTTASWATTPPMSLQRGYGTSTLLPSGKVLVVGGQSAGTGTNTVELFNPTTSTWASTTSLDAGRLFHTATLLSNGKVLVVGGAEDLFGNPQGRVDLFDPNTQQWSPSAPLAEARFSHEAVALADGRVLVMGGWKSFTGPELFSNSAEVYDPTTNSWADAGTMHARRHTEVGLTATLLPDGRVLVTGQIDLGDVPAEVFDAVTNSWTVVSPWNFSHVKHAAVRLQSGKVLVVGGSPGAQEAETYDGVRDRWDDAGVTALAREETKAARLSNGRVLVAGDLGSAVTLPAAVVSRVIARPAMSTQGRPPTASAVRPTSG